MSSSCQAGPWPLAMLASGLCLLPSQDPWGAVCEKPLSLDLPWERTEKGSVGTGNPIKNTKTRKSPVVGLMFPANNDIPARPTISIEGPVLEG